MPLGDGRDRRAELAELSRAAKGGIVAVEDAARGWGASRQEASARLARLTRRGWLTRLKRGTYYIPSLDSGADPVADDPWVVAAQLFNPCYVGGWTAAHHWGLTEQLFHETFVVTAANIRQREQTVLGAAYRLVRVSRSRIEGVGTLWRGAVRVRVSNPERTLVDAFADPSWVGGVRHLVEILAAYRRSEHASADRLAKELAGSGTGAAHKRLGFVVELLWPDATGLIDVALEGRSSGVIRLDPAIPSRGKLSRRWGLWLNVPVSRQGE